MNLNKYCQNCIHLKYSERTYNCGLIEWDFSYITSDIGLKIFEVPDICPNILEMTLEGITGDVD